MEERFFEPIAFDDFCRAFTEELTQLRLTHQAGLQSARRELERIKREIQQVVDAIKAGFGHAELKAEMDKLHARKETLLALEAIS
jgi:hypothetical protein